MIRRAHPEDARAIHEAHMRSIREICSKDHAEDEVRGWGNRPYDEDRRLSAIRDQWVWVIERNGCIEGFAEVHVKNEAGTVFIHALYLTPEIAGQGFGKQLLNTIISEARSVDAKKVALNSTRTAHEFYFRYGFRDTGPEKKDLIGGSWVRNTPMAMSLE